MGSSDEPVEQAPPPGTVQLPVPPNPLPFELMFGAIGTADGRMVILAVAQNPSGSATTGILTPEQAEAIGRDLMALGRECSVRRSLIVAGVAS